MIAKVKYNDLKGTAAADVSDFYLNNLQGYLKKEFQTYDSNRYNCVGCTLWISGQAPKPMIDVDFICWDSQDSKYVKVRPEKDYDFNQAFALFKRLQMVLGTNIEDIQVDEDDVVTLG